MTPSDDQKSPLDQIMASINELRQEVRDSKAAIESIFKAFPEGDIGGHCRYHEEIIQSMVDRRKLRQELISHLVKSSTWAALIGAAIVLWQYLKISIKA